MLRTIGKPCTKATDEMLFEPLPLEGLGLIKKIERHLDCNSLVELDRREQASARHHVQPLIPVVDLTKLDDYSVLRPQHPTLTKENKPWTLRWIEEQASTRQPLVEVHNQAILVPQPDHTPELKKRQRSNRFDPFRKSQSCSDDSEPAWFPPTSFPGATHSPWTEPTPDPEEPEIPLPPSNPPSPETGAASLPLAAPIGERVLRTLSCTLGKLRTLDTMLDRLPRDGSDARADPVRQKILRDSVKARLPPLDDSDDDEPDVEARSWKGFSEHDIRMMRESFVEWEMKLLRKGHPYAPVMPSRFNPLRIECAPPCSWRAFPNPYSNAKEWKVHRQLRYIPVRSRQACELGNYYKHCVECKRDGLLKHVLSSKPRNELWRSLKSTATPSAARRARLWVPVQPASLETLTAEDDEEEPMEGVILTDPWRNHNALSSGSSSDLSQEFEFDYYDSDKDKCPDAPRLKDMDDLSLDDDDDSSLSIWDEMDTDDEDSVYILADEKAELERVLGDLEGLN